MNGPGVDIGELTLRVGGVERERAAPLGERVARLVAEQLRAAQSDAPVILGALELRLRLRPSEITAERLSSEIARRIIAAGRVA